MAFLVVQGADDLDEDGAPDAWETSVGLNPNNSADGAADPAFVNARANDFRFFADSALKDIGMDLGGLDDDDVRLQFSFESRRPDGAGLDVGAFEGPGVVRP